MIQGRFRAKLHQPLPASNQLLVVAVREIAMKFLINFSQKEDKHEQHET